MERGKPLRRLRAEQGLDQRQSALRVGVDDAGGLLGQLGFRCSDETDNPAARFFLR